LLNANNKLSIILLSCKRFRLRDTSCQFQQKYIKHQLQLTENTNKNMTFKNSLRMKQ
jgi:hypothetical protein